VKNPECFYVVAQSIAQPHKINEDLPHCGYCVATKSPVRQLAENAQNN